MSLGCRSWRCNLQGARCLYGDQAQRCSQARSPPGAGGRGGFRPAEVSRSTRGPPRRPRGQGPLTGLGSRGPGGGTAAGRLHGGRLTRGTWGAALARRERNRVFLTEEEAEAEASPAPSPALPVTAQGQRRVTPAPCARRAAPRLFSLQQGTLD